MVTNLSSDIPMTGNGDTGVRWFYVQEGRRKGPLGLAELVALILGGDLPEDTLIWRVGLGEWVKANSVEEIQRELPPPIPGKDGYPSDQVGASSPKALAQELDEAEPDEAERDEAEPLETNPAAGSGKPGGHRRRRHRPRYRLAAGRRRWLVPLIVMLIVVVVVLWYLLRRFNEVPQGQVILQGALSEEARPAGARSCPVRRGA
jgi:hypothetical protein